MRVSVVGLGLIGGSAALAFRARGWDRDPEARRQARARGVETADDLASTVDGAEVVLLAVPSGEIPAGLELVAGLAPSALLTDAASWKRPALEAAVRLPEATRYVAGHPMAGAAASGVAAARADLFHGKPWLLVPTVRSDDASIIALTTLVRTAGAIPRVVAGDTHDAAMTWASHLPLAVAVLEPSDSEVRGRRGRARRSGPSGHDPPRRHSGVARVGARARGSEAPRRCARRGLRGGERAGTGASFRQRAGREAVLRRGPKGQERVVAHRFHPSDIVFVHSRPTIRC